MYQYGEGDLKIDSGNTTNAYITFKTGSSGVMQEFCMPECECWYLHLKV